MTGPESDPERRDRHGRVIGKGVTLWDTTVLLTPIEYLNCKRSGPICVYEATHAIWGPCGNWQHDPLILCEFHLLLGKQSMANLMAQLPEADKHLHCPVCGFIGGQAYRYIRLEKVPHIRAWWKAKMGLMA